MDPEEDAGEAAHDLGAAVLWAKWQKKRCPLKRGWFCQVTGLPVDNRPGWCGQSFGDRYTANFLTVGRSVLHSAPSGRAGIEQAKASLALNAKVAGAVGDGESPYVLIEDLTDFKSIDLQARRLVGDNLSATNRLLGVVFCNASIVIDAVIRLDRRFNNYTWRVGIASDYESAITAALAICAEHGVDPGPGVFEGPPVRFAESGDRLNPVEILTDEEWNVECDGFRNDAMLIDGRILHSVAAGMVTDDCLPLLETMRSQVKSATDSPVGLEYIVVDSRAVLGAPRRVRLAYLESLKAWHRHSPFSSYIMYGIEPFSRAALRMARPFMPFRMDMLRDLGETFASIRAEASTGDRKAVSPAKSMTDHERSTVDELLAFLAAIEWDKEGTVIPPVVDEEDPLLIVFESIKLVKDELDQLMGERSEAERRIAESERKFRDLFEHSTDLLYFHDLDGVVLNSNLAFKEEYGWTDPNKPLPSIPEMVPERQRDGFRDYIDGIVSSGRASGHMTVATASGREVILEYDSKLVLDEFGSPVGVNGAARDVTEQFRAASEKRALEEELRHAHRMEAVGTLADGVAHEFNNFLAVIQGHCEIALDDARSGKVNEASLQQVLDTSARARDLVLQICAFSRGGGRGEAHVDLRVEIPSIVGLLERTIPKMVAIDLRLDPRLESICASRAQIEEVLVNLASNAADSMPDGGTLTISTAAATHDEIGRRGLDDRRADAYARLSVADTGVGMTRDHLRRVYDPFFTTKDIGKGTGLGLSAVYGMITGLGGSIDCTSEPGSGTTFDIYLPIWRAETDHGGNTAVLDSLATRTNGRGGIGLLVDDNDAVRNLASKFLERLGYKVIAAESGERALEIYRSQAADVDFVLLDLGMPGMGGQKCLERLCELDPELPVIVASGYAIGSARDAAIAGGARHFMAKPYQLAELSRVLQEVLSSPRQLVDGTRQ